MPRPCQRVCLQGGLKLELNRLIRRGTVRPGAGTGPQLKPSRSWNLLKSAPLVKKKRSASWTGIGLKETGSNSRARTIRACEGQGQTGCGRLVKFIDEHHVGPSDARAASKRDHRHGRVLRARREWPSLRLGNLLRGTNWLLGSGFCRSRCWLGYHDRIGNRLRNIDGFRAGLMSTNHAGSP
jgi:hypothetical protein